MLPIYKKGRTFVPQAAVSVAHFALTDLAEVKDTDTEPNIVENTISVFFVNFCDYSFIDRYFKL